MNTPATLRMSRRATTAALVRALETTSGTVCGLLAALTGEPLAAGTVLQREAVAASGEELGVAAGDRLVHREALLVGSSSGRPYVAADCRYAPAQLPEPVRKEFLLGHEPIGHILDRTGLRVAGATSPDPPGCGRVRRGRSLPCRRCGPVATCSSSAGDRPARSTSGSSSPCSTRSPADRRAASGDR